MTRDHRPGRFVEPATDRLPVVQPRRRAAPPVDASWEDAPGRAPRSTTKIVAIVVIALFVLGSAGGLIAGALS